MSWLEQRVHVIDFEGSVRTGVVEYGVVTLRAGRIEGVETAVCRPRRAVPAEEARVHGLGGDAVRAAAGFEAAWPLFAALRETGVLAAHFSSAEESMLRSYWPCPRLSPDWLEPGREVATWGPWIDTGRIAAERVPAGASVALEDLVARFGLGEALAELAGEFCPAERRRFHCALFDALACALLLLEFAGGGGSRAPWSLARLLAASTADKKTREARSQPRLPGF
ncbi:MAG: 3'-5' exonuclease [Verrucomicrobia bacterium]|nr:MAG: 3'-5' exonuclease [Verrucomicrobiota bacterium]